MGFESYRQGTFTKRLADLPDQPNMQAAELKTYFDSSPEELRQALNRLCHALGEFSAAAKLGYTASAGVPAQTVQDAIENVQKQVRDASVGKLPSGCVDGDKLAQDVRDRFTAIENSVQAEAHTRSSMDATLQQSLEQAGQVLTCKAEITASHYVGDGQANREIKLGYRPKAVLLFREGYYTSYGNAMYGGLATDGSPVMYGERIALGITDEGFEVLHNSSCAMNQNTCVYTYLAIK